MTTPWQTALIEHRRGFAAERAGRLDLAAPHFRAALAGFASLSNDPAWHDELRNRAERIVQDDADILVADFLRAWPRWLLDLHYERTLHAVRIGDHCTAAYHWSVLTTSGSLLKHLGTDTLELYRDRLALACIPDVAGADVADRSESDRLELLRLGGRLLAVDPSIVRVRLFAMRVCVREVEDLLRKKSARALEYQRGGSRLLRGMATADRRTQAKVRRMARMLGRHLRALGQGRDADPVELVAGYRVLAAYLGRSEPARALAALRRARRIAPTDPELAVMYRTLRRGGRY